VMPLADCHGDNYDLHNLSILMLTPYTFLDKLMSTSYTSSMRLAPGEQPMTTLKEHTAHWISKRAQQKATVAHENPFLEGQYAPVSVETTSTDLKVTGTIPEELNGVLARIGPNPITVPNPATYHWFVGDGMVHGLRLREGKAVWYRNRWVGTDRANKALGRPLVPGQKNGVVDTVNTNIIGHAGRLWALVEAGAVPVEMDLELNSVKQGLFDHDQRGPFTAH